MSVPEPYTTPYVTYVYLGQNYVSNGGGIVGNLTTKNLLPAADDTYSIGSSGSRYQSIFAYAADFKTPLPTASGGTHLSAAGTAGNVLTSDGTNWTSAPSSGSIWQTVFNESGASLANWTQPAGTWTTDGTAFDVDTGSLTPAYLYYTNPVPQSGLVIECEMFVWFPDTAIQGSISSEFACLMAPTTTRATQHSWFWSAQTTIRRWERTTI